MAAGKAILAHAVSDADDRLVAAEEPLAGLQLRCGGELPGVIAIPALLEVVRKVRRYQLRLARRVTAQDGEETVAAWVEVAPRSDGEMGCEISLREMRSMDLAEEPADAVEERRAEIERHLAEFTAWLDVRQCVLAVESDAVDLAGLCEAMKRGIGRPWTDFVTLESVGHRQPLHWRLLDGASLSATGSSRQWRAQLVPQGLPGSEPTGFELLLVSDEPAPVPAKDTGEASETRRAALIGADVAPALRQPIDRIKANAETIRSRLAGPLPEKYAEYAGEIVTSAEQLLGLLEDLSTLEVVDVEGFSTIPDQIDLAEVARYASGLVRIAARERNITMDEPRPGESLPAIGEQRRVLQILGNLLRNAIKYSPEGSSVWIRLEEAGERARVTVADQGPGIPLEQCEAVFDKWERLGRSGDGGSGLGLYISRKLARAMGGELEVESAPGQGARFILELPADPEGGAQQV